MMKERPPRLSIGLPVFNGEKYITYALDSLLAQSFTDFELIISDNASTDSTSHIARKYVSQDSRIRYYCNPENIGAMQNWYRAFELSRSQYFLGVAHDDIFHPRYIERCIETLDSHPEAVICYSLTKVIDADGNFVRDFAVKIDTASPHPHVRLYNVINVDYLCIQLLGVFRADAFRAVRQFVGYYGCDRNVLAEFGLLGPILEVPEYLFYHRLHQQALGVARNSGRSISELKRLDPGINWEARFPSMTRFINYFSSVQRLVGGLKDRILCYSQLSRIVIEKSFKRIFHKRLSTGG